MRISGRRRTAWVVGGVVAAMGAGVSAHPGHGAGPEPVAQAAAGGDESRVVIEERDGFRSITSNGLPDHEPGRFPNRGNPHAIGEQAYRFRVPLRPTANQTPTPNEFGPFGVAVNGVPFDPGTAEFWRRDRASGWREEAILPGDRGQLGMDEHHAHVQPNGAYHYHGLPTGLVARLGGGRKMVLVGYAADGFPIYNSLGHRDAEDAQSPLVELRPSYRLKQGTRPAGDAGPGGRYDGKYTRDYEYVAGLGDLDACNGRTGVTPEHPRGTYYYVLTETFPNVPRMWRGEPDASFERGPGGPPGGGGGPGRGGERTGPPGGRDRPPPPR